MLEKRCKPWVRSGVAGLMLAAVAGSGCASSRSTAVDPAVRDAANAGADTKPAPSADATPTKALLPLAEITPEISPPKPNPEVPPLSDRAKEHIANAEDLLAQRRYTEAAIELERALRSDPNHPAVNAVLSVLHWQAENVERARTHATRSIEESPHLAAPHYVLGRYQTQAGERNPALYQLRTALLCDDFGEDPELAALTHFHLAGLLAEAGYAAAALEQYEEFDALANELRSVSQERTFSTEFANLLASMPASVAEPRAQLLSRLGRHAEAADVLRTVVESRPHDPDVVREYADLLTRAGRLEEAFTAVRSIDSNDEEVLSLMYRICEKLGQPQRAIAEIETRVAQNPEEPELVFRLASILEQAGRGDEARRVLTSFLEDHPDDDAVRARLVETLLRQSAWADALALAAEAVENNAGRSREMRALFIRHAATDEAVDGLIAAASGSAAGRGFAASYLAGVTAARSGRTADARRLLERAYRNAPEFLPARVALAWLRYEQYDYAAALALLVGDEDGGDARAEGPDSAEAQALLARIYERLDDVEAAERHFRRALQLDRSDDETMLALAQMFFRTGKTLEAQRQLKILLQVFPDNEAARELLAMSYFQEGKRDLAVEAFRELKSRTRRPATRARCEVMADPAMQANPDEVRKVLLTAMEEGEPDAATWLAVAATYGATELAEQRKAFSEAVALDPGREEALLGLSRVSQFELDLEGSAEYLSELLRRRPNHHEWRRRLIELYLVLTDFDAAVERIEEQLARADLDNGGAGFERALPAEERTNYRAALLRTLARAERDDEIVERLEAWIAEDSENLTWSSWLAEHYLGREKPEFAADVYQRLYERESGNWGIRRRLIAALAAADAHDRAAQYCLDWLQEDPGDDQAMHLLAAVLGDAGDTDAALELIRSRLLRTIQREIFQNLWVSQLLAADRHDDAVQTCETLLDTVIRVLRENPRRSGPDWDAGLREDELIYFPNGPFVVDKLHARLESLRVQLITTLVAAKDYRRAADLVTEWLDQSSEPSTRHRYLRLLAYCHQAEGHDEKAAAALERALMIEPTDVGLNNDLAYTWIDRGVRLDDAEPLIRYAVGHAPDQGAYLDTYGWLLYKKGEFAEAEKWLHRANAARGNNDPVVLDHLGDAAWQQGHRDAAVDYWTQAVAVVADREEDDLANADERRVKATTQQKIDAAKAGDRPVVAPLAEPRKPDGKATNTQRT